MKRIRGRIRARREALRVEADASWSFLIALVTIALIWRLVAIYSRSTQSCGTHQRFWTAGHLQDASLLEAFGAVFLALSVLFIAALFTSRTLRPVRRGLEFLLIAGLIFSWAQMWSGFFPDSRIARGFAPIAAFAAPLTGAGGQAGELETAFLGKDGQYHPYTPSLTPPVFFGEGCDCFSREESRVAQAYREREAILSTGIAPDMAYLERWAGLPAYPENPKWCPYPDGPIGGL